MGLGYYDPSLDVSGLSSSIHNDVSLNAGFPQTVPAKTSDMSMKPCYLLLILSLFVLQACKMGNNKPASEPATVFSGHKTIGDCKPSEETSSAQSMVRKVLPKAHCSKQDTLVTGHIKQLCMVTRNPSSTGEEFGYRAIYDTGVTWTIMFRPVEGESGGMETWGYVSMPAKHKGDTVIEGRLLQDMAALAPGCKTLSYYDSKPYAPDGIISPHTDEHGYSMILFKGHYDVELN